MEILLTDPNIVYVLLALGALLAYLAALSPGTGLLEVGALFMLLLAGYGVYTSERPVNLWALIVLLLGVAPFLVAVRKSKNYFYLLIAVGAFTLGSVYLFQGEVWWRPAVSPLVAAPVSLVVAVLVWWMTRRALEADQVRPAHDLTTLVGQIGEAKTVIHSEGAVQVGGELWSARSAEAIPPGAAVRVLRRDGLVLEVEKVDDLPVV